MTNHRCNPFSSVDVAMVVDSRLGAFTSTAPEMNTLDIPPFEGFAGSDELGVGREGSLQALPECQMIGIRVICAEPREARQGGSGIHNTGRRVCLQA